LLKLETGTIKLSHFSVKEYLLSTQVEKDFRISEKTSHSVIAQISVAYLLQFNLFDHLTEAILDCSPLARYAAKHWSYHAKAAGVNMTRVHPILKLILRLFTFEIAAFTNWVRICNIDKWNEQQWSMDRAEVPSPLYYASLAGMQQVSSYLLERGADANVQKGRYGNALQAASYGGHEVIVKLLLENGAEVNAQGGHDGNALQAASSRGHEVIVKLLLDKHAQEDHHGNTLQAASFIRKSL